MRLTPTEVNGAFVIDLEPHEDERGVFARTFDAKVFAEHGMEPLIAQANMSINHRAGTLRGLHRQVPPHAEAKLVRCVAGTVVDVAVDIRPGSPTYGRYAMVELSAANHRAFYLPPFVLHGYESLTDSTEVHYQVSGPYVPGAEEGYRYDDPFFAIPWPMPPTEMSAKDAAWPAYTPKRTDIS